MDDRITMGITCRFQRNLDMAGDRRLGVRNASG